MKKLLIISCCCMQFIVSLHAQQQLSKAEYFFNTDPGIGNATPILFTAADSIHINTNIQIPNSLTGLNLLFVRVANAAGVWSFPEISLIWVSDAGQNIVSGEYFFDTDPGIGNGTAFTIPVQGDSIDIIQNITIPTLSLGAHKLYVRTKSTNGTWSFPEMRAINICTSYGPDPDFTYYINGSEVYFTDSSKNAVSRIWSFGDNSAADTSVNPRHIFPQGNTYNVKLKTVNACGVDSVVKSVSIFGVQSISPTEMATTGIYVGYVKGIGFLPGTTSRLIKTGSASIAADTTIIINQNLLKVIFKNSDEALGQYDLAVKVPGSSEQTLVNALTMVPPGAMDIWASLDGRRELLVNRWTTYRVQYGNNGNTTAIGVPLFISVPGNVSARLLTKTNDTTLQAELLNAIADEFYIYRDSLTGDSARYSFLLIPYLEAGHTGEIIFELKTNAPPTDFDIVVQTGNGFYSDNDVVFRRSNGRTTSSCFPPCIQCIVDVATSTPGVPPIIGCPIGLGATACGIADALTSGSSAGSQAISIMGQVAGAILNCVPAGPLVSYSIHTMGKINWRAVGLSFGGGVAGGLGGFGEDGAPSSCGTCFKPPKKDKLHPRFSWDPNVKAGPQGYNTQQYTRWQDPFNYTVHFENLSSATAPASEVFITDYIDTTKFDMNSFRFTGFGFADTSFHFTLTDKLFIKDVDLRPSKQAIVRVTGLLDSVNKLSFKFSSFDPASMRLTEDIAQGFLNPNTNGKEGLGYVTFQVRCKPTLPTGTMINNTASIIFDANPVINTPVWFNSIDKNKPSSNVLSVAEKIDDTTYTIRWTGSDAHAGIRHYAIYVSTNDSVFVKYTTTDSLHLNFTGQLGKKYEFYSVATDFVDNIEEVPSVPDLEFEMLPTILPVRWVEFNAVKQGEKVRLRWRTSFEQNNKGFEIQQSTNGSSFQRLGWVDGAGNSSAGHSYVFIDSTPSKGKNFYRLKQVDLDNKSLFSEVRRVDFTQSVDFIVYPDPVRDRLNIQFSDNDPKDIIIQDMLGRRLWMAKNVNHYSLSVPVQQLENGLFLVIVIDKHGRQTVQKFIKH